MILKDNPCQAISKTFSSVRIILNAPSLTYWIAKKVVSILIRYHLSLMLISRNIKEAKSQLPLFKISVKILTNLYWLN
ncbi:hypothetical protein HMPREF1421_00488 [Helicobacter pylori GAM265BSii]|uniref:Uncharacterized protein n=1 Tax=Helicobacter pylori GAM265BSii TaxID=1159049 RepID=M3RAB0_HELPX|nr:hypothetical protein HMPREF1421_00488 [Helicobacter pylori GAM265BSii]